MLGDCYSHCKRSCGVLNNCASYHDGGNHGLNNVSFINFSVAEHPKFLTYFFNGAAEISVA